MTHEENGKKSIPQQLSAGAMPSQLTDTNDELRQMLEHPLLVKGVVLPTNPVNELVVALRRAVMMREQGCCFTGISGFGKTYGLAMAENELRRLFVGVPIIRHIVNNQQYPSIRSFFKHFLITVGEHNIKGETYDLRVRFANPLIDAGRATKMKLVVMLIDEAQEMALQDFCFLKDIGNDLEDNGVQFVAVMMAQEPDFSKVVQKLRDAGRLDLICRFTLRQNKFRGLASRDDLLHLLTLIDTQVYPVESGSTWPQFFVPNAWAAGFRMKDQVDQLIAALRKKLPDKKIENGVSARQLFLCIRRFIVDYADLETMGKPLPNSLWDAAVTYSLIEDAASIAAEDTGKIGKAKKNWKPTL